MVIGIACTIQHEYQGFFFFFNLEATCTLPVSGVIGSSINMLDVASLGSAAKFAILIKLNV